MNIGLIAGACVGAGAGYVAGVYFDRRIAGLCLGVVAGVAAVGLGILCGPWGYAPVIGIAAIVLVVKWLTRKKDQEKILAVTGEALQKSREAQIADIQSINPNAFYSPRQPKVITNTAAN